MKVLSVKQPWAYLICSGIKDIENRTWKCPKKHIGQRVLIHASAKPEVIEFEIAGRATVQEIALSTALNHCDEYELYSAIIGSVEIVDCVLNHQSIWAKKWLTKRYHAFGTMMSYEIQPYHWVLRNPILFDNPILNVKGKLGFWDYDLSEEYEKILKR